MMTMAIHHRRHAIFIQGENALFSVAFAVEEDAVGPRGTAPLLTRIVLVAVLVVLVGGQERYELFSIESEDLAAAALVVKLVIPVL